MSKTDKGRDEGRSIRDQLAPIRNKMPPADGATPASIIHLPIIASVAEVKRNGSDFYGGTLSGSSHFFHKAGRIGGNRIQISDSEGKAVLYACGTDPARRDRGPRAIEWCFVDEVAWSGTTPISREDYNALRRTVLKGLPPVELLLVVKGTFYSNIWQRKNSKGIPPPNLDDGILLEILADRLPELARSKISPADVRDILEKCPYRDLDLGSGSILHALLKAFSAEELSKDLPCLTRYHSLVGQDTQDTQSKLFEWGLRDPGKIEFSSWVKLIDLANPACVEAIGNLSRDEAWVGRALNSVVPSLPGQIIACNAVAFDLETDGEKIWQIGIADAGGKKELLFDNKKPGLSLEEGLKALAARLKSKRYIVGHNVLQWDIPVLRKLDNVLFADLPVVWDTLLVSCLIDPAERHHALNSDHRADDDAQAAFTLFQEQVRGFGASAANNLLQQNPPSSTEDLLRRLGFLCERNPLSARTAPDWTMGLFNRRPPCGIALLPRAQLRRCYWDGRFAPVVLRNNTAVRLHEPSLPPSKDDSPWKIVARFIMKRAERNGLHLIPDMLPPVLRLQDGLGDFHDKALTAAAEPSGKLMISAIPVTRAEADAATAMSAVYACSGEGLILDEDTVGLLPQNLQRDANRLPTAPTLYRDDKDGWFWYEPISANQANGRPWRKFTALRLDSFARLARTDGWAIAYEVPDMGGNDCRSPTAPEQLEYWIEVVERFLAVAKSRPDDDARSIPILFLVSTREGIVRDRLETALEKLGFSMFNGTRSRMERLRKTIGSAKPLYAVDFIAALDEWCVAASALDMKILPIIEALPLPEWYALSACDEDADGTEEVISGSEGVAGDDDEDREAGDAQADTDADEEMDTQVPAAGEQALEIVPHARIARTTFVEERDRLKQSTDEWLCGLGVPDGWRVVLLDTRLAADRPEWSKLRPIQPDDYHREELQRILDPLQPRIEREAPEATPAALENYLRQHWKYDAFQPWQRAAAEAIARHDADVLVTLPTGGGKSILFQVPALYRGEKRRTLSLVISPLRALMQDQVQKLHELGFHDTVDYLSADRPWHENEVVFQGVLDHRITLLYVAPERFRNRRFLDLLDRRYRADGCFEFLIVDEAHCISQWGYEFRPDYFYAIKVLNKRYRESNAQNDRTPFLLFSATVTARTRKDIEAVIGTTRMQVVPGEYFHPIREHIEIRTIAVAGSIAGSDPKNWILVPRLEEIRKLIDQALSKWKESGAEKSAVIVFVSRRGHAEELALELGRHYKEKVGYFHAGLDAEQRQDIYEAYKAGGLDILVATKAFGMGMDIGHIHWAIHLSPPTYMEDYFQEIGRIGRDEQAMAAAGLNSLQAVLLHSPDDFSSNHANVQRSRIDFPQLDEFLKQINSKVKYLGGAGIVLVPDVGYENSLRNAAHRRTVATRVRVMLHWLEKMGRIEVLQMLPNLLPVRIDDQRLERWIDDDSAKGQVARCLLMMANHSVGQAGQATPAANGGGLLERILDGLARFFGFLFGPPPAIAAQPAAPAAGGEGLIDLAAISRATSLSVFDTLIALSDLQNAGDVKILRSLHFSVGKTRRQLKETQASAFLGHLLAAAQAVSDLIDGRGQVQITDELVGAPFAVKDADGKDVDLKQAAGKGLAFLLRCAGARTLQKTVVDGESSYQGLFATLDRGRNRNAPARIVNLAKSIVDVFANSLPDGGDLELHRLLQITSGGNLPGQDYRKRELQQALGLLAATRLVYCSEPLVPLSYVLEVKKPGEPFRKGDHGVALGELEEANRMAELRAHAMELFVALPEEARDEFVQGYFSKEDPSALEGFLEEQIKNISEPGQSGWASEKLRQIRAVNINEFFDLYRAPDAASPEQWQAISRPWNRHLLVNAGPGSGKTSVLLARAAYLIHKEGLKPENILVLAFNRAVVFEIRSRIRELFHGLGYGGYVRSLKVSTFHALATKHVGRVPDNVLQVFALRLEHNPSFRQAAANDLRAILVDEFQDADPDIIAIIRQLQAASGAFVMAIGDDDQDILRWNRIQNDVVPANALEGRHYFDEFKRIFQPDQITLGVNFRSAPEIIAKSQNLIGNQIPQRLKSGIVLQPRPGAGNGVIQVPIDQPAFHAAISGWLLDNGIQSGTESIAILCRTNAEVVALHRQWQPELPRLRILQTDADFRLDRLRHIACLLDICNSMIGKDGNRPLASCRGELLKQFGNLAIPEARGQAPFSPGDILDLVEAESSYARLSDVIEFAGTTRVDECHRMLDRRAAGNDGGAGAKPAIVATIHKVKGLEFDRVVIIPSDARFPLNGNGDMEGNVAEEARLFYVALSRAKQAAMFRFGDRERAWWVRNPHNPQPQGGGGPVRMLEGSPREVVISWAARAGNPEAQEYIKRHVAVGDEIQVNHASLFHNIHQIGALANGLQGGQQSSLRVSAVMRYPQVLDSQNPQYFQGLTQAVRDRGWSYIVLVSGVL